MIDPQTEQIVRLQEVHKITPGGPVAFQTPWRWAKEGVGGIKLETVKFANRRWTSVEAVQRFWGAIAARNTRQTPTAPRKRRSAERDGAETGPQTAETAN